MFRSPGELAMQPVWIPLSRRAPDAPQNDLYPGLPSRSLLRASCCSCRSCTPGSQSWPTWPIGRPRIAGNSGVTQGLHIRPILVDPCVYLIGSADGPVAGDEDIDVVRHALEQPQRGEVIPDPARGAVQVEQRNEDIRKHVAGDEHAAFLDHQRRMARGM